MSLESWIAFVVTAFVVLIIPGPTIILVVGRALSHGKRAVLPLVVGVTLGDFTGMTLSLLGLGAILATSATLFTVFKWAGALYLFYLGVKTWRTDPAQALTAVHALQGSNQALLRSAYVVTALNPKSIAFFVAFLPQFINPNTPHLPQFLILGATFLVLAALNAAIYALFAGQMFERMQSVTVKRWFNRFGGTALIGAGLLTASMERSR